MKTLPIPAPSLTRLKASYDALMLDDLPIDFDKMSELIQAVGVVVRSLDTMPLPKPRIKIRVMANGERHVKQL